MYLWSPSSWLSHWRCSLCLFSRSRRNASDRNQVNFSHCTAPQKYRRDSVEWKQRSGAQSLLFPRSLSGSRRAPLCAACLRLFSARSFIQVLIWKLSDAGIKPCLISMLLFLLEFFFLCCYTEALASNFLIVIGIFIKCGYFFGDCLFCSSLG